MEDRIYLLEGEDLEKTYEKLKQDLSSTAMRIATCIHILLI